MRSSAVSGHELVQVETPDSRYGFAVACTCGWQSGPARSRHAERRWEIHVDAARAAAACFAAETTVRRAQVRMAELSRLRETTRARRAAIQEARRQLASLHRNLPHDAAAVRYARPTLLEAAREMAGLSFAQLWVAYFSIGGNLTAPELVSALRDSTLLPHWDLNLIALALNEAFAETGLGRPLDYWGAERDGGS